MKNNNLTNLVFVSVKEKEGKFIAFCQEDCKQLLYVHVLLLLFFI